MVHIVKKKITVKSTPAYTFSDVEIQQLNTSLRTLGCTPNAPGWTRAMQVKKTLYYRLAFEIRTYLICLNEWKNSICLFVILSRIDLGQTRKLLQMK